MAVSTFKQMIRSAVPAKVRKPLTLLRYRGDKMECPCCNGRFSTFWPSGVNEKPNTMCPRCNSLERHRLLWMYLSERTDLGKRPLRLLHVAPEPLFERRFREAAGVDYLSADLMSPQAMVRMDLTAIDMPDCSFDAIICSHVLEHIPDDVQAMREMHRILKPDGWAILQSPIDTSRTVTYEDWSITSEEDRLREFGQEDHVRVYGLDYEDRLRSAGFDLSVVRYPDELGPERVLRHGLQHDEWVYVGRKGRGVTA